MSRLFRVLCAALLITVGGTVFGAATASAHTALESSTPANGATLDKRPTEVTFVFAEPLLPDFVKFIALDDAGTTSDLTVKSIDGGTAVVDWPAEFAEGTWTVEYRVVSQDGHPVNGNIAFTYSAPTPEPTSSSAQPTSSSAAPSPTATPAPASSSAAPRPTESSVNPSPSASPAAGTTSNSTGWIIAAVAVFALAAVAIAGLIARNRSQ